MELWQVEVIKAAVLMVTGFVGGVGSYWLRNREREKERKSEIEKLRAKRRLEGTKEAERLASMEKLTDILVKHQEHEITPERFIEFSDAVLRTRRSKQTRRAPIPTGGRPIEERGPNGGRVERLANGDKVEWIVDDGEEFSMILFRGEEQIREAEGEYFDKVWWNRHQIWKEKIEAGEEPRPEPQLWATATRAAKRIEDKYGVDNLGWDDFEWGMVNGKLSALRWVLGDQWDFLDT